MEFNALVSFALATLFFGVGIQIYGNDLLLRTGLYHYRTRLPQAITALLAGIGLSVSGLLMQTLFRNPLADPSLLASVAVRALEWL